MAAPFGRYGELPFQEAIEYFNRKLPAPTTGWQDVYGQQHDHAFMVAGANRRAIVEDFATAVQAAIEQGETLADFRVRFDDIVARHGWDYKGSRGWRSRLIYETNVRQAYNAGREAQMADPAYRERFPYMEYRHSGAENYRPQHKAWDRLVLAADDPWWNVHSPSNGYGCKCKKYPVSRRELKRLGKERPDPTPQEEYREFLDKRTGEVRQIPLGIDPGFDHRPGESWIRHSTPRFIERWPEGTSPIPFGRPDRGEMPPPKPAADQLLLEDDLNADQYVAAFMAEFPGQGPVFKDVIGEPLVISDQLFRKADGELALGEDKTLRQRLRLLARTIQQPDEIWSLLVPDIASPGKYRLIRRYIARWLLGGSGQVPAHTVFETGQGLWTAYTGAELDGALDELRQGVRLYRRATEE